jgi:hypothetical protein
MKPATRWVFALLALPAMAFTWGGCQGIAVAGNGYEPVYADYGYVGPWDSGRVEVEGGYYAAPPFGRPDQDRRGENSGRREAAPPERSRAPERPAPVQQPAPVQHAAPVQHPAPVQHAAPVQQAAPRPIPSIPNNPRPTAPQR